jgi:hypothetical protein
MKCIEWKHNGTWIVDLYTRVPELLVCAQEYLNYWPIQKGNLNYGPVHKDAWIIGLYIRVPELLACT